MNKKSVIKFLLKLLISFVALYYVISRIDFSEIRDMLLTADIYILLLALFVYSLSQLASAHRLRKLFLLLPVSIRSIENIKLYWLGLFYNLFLPGGVGGDGFKVWFVKKHYNIGIKRVVGALLSDRVSGLVVILMMLLIIVPILDYPIPYNQYFWYFLPLAPLSFFLFLHLFNRSLKPAFVSVYFWAVIVQLLQMLAAIIILHSINADLKGNYEEYIFLFFLSAIAGSLPLTLGGIGARELVFFEGAHYLGIDAGSAVFLSLLFYAISVITSLPGLLYTFKPSLILEGKRQQKVSGL